MSELKIDGELLELMIELYTAGYLNGHNDTVEGVFTDVYQADKKTYFKEEVLEVYSRA